MKVDAGVTSIYSYSAKLPVNSARFSEGMKAEVNATKQVEPADMKSANDSNFRSMTVADFRDWLGKQIETGEIGPNDVFPYMALSIVMPESGTGAHDYALNIEKRDFLSSAQASVKSARQTSDVRMADQFQRAIDTMLKSQSGSAVRGSFSVRV